MKQHLHDIREKVNLIQSALLRFQDKDKLVTLHVKAVANEDESIDCVVTESDSLHRLVNKKVRVVQKYKDDYIYISGKVSAEVRKNKRILSIVINRACWFERRSKGGVTWLHEKYIYDRIPLPLAS
ncbi:MAG TPA: hypothetical protein VK644_02245 [Chitinophagaceae bacterium]|nr:hypothetical protein [Chitinophagaceae bacterium]